MISAATEKDKKCLKKHALDLIRQKDYSGFGILIDELKLKEFQISKRTDFAAAIMYAIENGQRNVIKHILNYPLGKKIHRVFFCAVYCGDIETSEKLLELGADVNQADGRCLRMSCAHGNIKMVTWLLDNGANINAFNNASIYVAAMEGNLELLKLLIDRGACLEDAPYLLSNAAESGNVEILKYCIEELGLTIRGDNFSGLYWAATKNKIDTVRYLCELNIDLTFAGPLALKLAAEKGFDEIASILLDRGVDVHTEGDMAIRYAAQGGKMSTFKLLLERGADIERITESDFAIMRLNKHFQMIDLVKEALSNASSDNN